MCIKVAGSIHGEVADIAGTKGINSLEFAISITRLRSSGASLLAGLEPDPRRISDLSPGRLQRWYVRMLSPTAPTAASRLAPAVVASLMSWLII